MANQPSEGDFAMNKAVARTDIGVKIVPKREIALLWKAILKYRWLYVMMLPGMIYFLVFRYLPLWNAQIAFKDFKPLSGG